LTDSSSNPTIWWPALNDFLTHKMVSRALKGRRLTLNTQQKVLNALIRLPEGTSASTSFLLIDNPAFDRFIFSIQNRFLNGSVEGDMHPEAPGRSNRPAQLVFTCPFLLPHPVIERSPTGSARF
jgi:hypothetical protein